MNSTDLCLITGGGSGIGRATAIKFAQNDIKTVIVGRREEALKETISWYIDPNNNPDLKTNRGITR